MSRGRTSGGRVDVVFDCYWDISIKSTERRKHGVQWNLLKECNYSTDRVQLFHSAIIERCSLYVTLEKDCWRFKCEDRKVCVTAVPKLSCNHEKADTRVILHAAHAASSGYMTVNLAIAKH